MYKFTALQRSIIQESYPANHTNLKCSPNGWFTAMWGWYLWCSKPLNHAFDFRVTTKSTTSPVSSCNSYAALKISHLRTFTITSSFRVTFFTFRTSNVLRMFRISFRQLKIWRITMNILETNFKVIRRKVKWHFNIRMTKYFK